MQSIRLNQPFAMLDYRVHARAVVSTRASGDKKRRIRKSVLIQSIMIWIKDQRFLRVNMMMPAKAVSMLVAGSGIVFSPNEMSSVGKLLTALL